MFPHIVFTRIGGEVEADEEKRVKQNSTYVSKKLLSDEVFFHTDLFRLSLVICKVKDQSLTPLLS